EGDVFCSYSLFKFTIYGYPHFFGFRLHDALAGQDHFNLTGSNAKSNSTECTMGRCVTVATNYCHSWLGKAQFRTDYMHDTMAVGLQIMVSDSMFLTILFKHVNLMA